MEIRVLRYFLAVAREENITHAAQRLHISQPTLSRQLKDLEDELGKKLFNRGSYSIKLTDEGMLLRRRAQEIIEMVDKTTDEFKALDEINGGDIQIGCAESQGIRHFLAAISSLKEQYPNIRTHLYSGGSEAVLDRLDKGLIDFAIVVSPADATKYNILEVPYQDRWGLLMPKDSPLAQKESIHLEDLKDLPLMTSRQSLESEIPSWFGDATADLDIVATYNLFFNASIMVEEGFGYALTFEGLADTSETSFLCFRPLESELCSPMYVIWKKYQVFTPIAGLLIDELKERFKTAAQQPEKE
ncbi:LysR family transcriptional regulator [Erysipelotrichaceae bacterium RD49]|nr:LysR family transcriptional regulator [Erysipelotrichaceae bacterium RD49]